MTLVSATEKHLKKWDEFVQNSINGTIFHKTKFLRYHGEKFKSGERFLVVLNGDEVYAQIALHIETNENGKKIAKSPYGASYGGFVFGSIPSYHKGKEVVCLLLDYLKSEDISSIDITQPSNFHCQYPMDTFIFNFLECGFFSYNRDILNIMDLKSKPVMDSIRPDCRTKIRKSQKCGIEICTDASIDDAYPLIEKTIKKFGKKPTHSFEELKFLSDEFKNDVYFVVAYYKEVPIAAVTNFIISSTVNNSFYLSSDENYSNLNALRYAVATSLQLAQDKGFEYYDFGTSSFMMKARKNIFSFKEQFSKIGLFRETVRWEIL